VSQKEVRRVVFGASLHAISKKGPIAGGLASKTTTRWATVRVLSILLPRQLGVGVRSGVAHAVRFYIVSASPYHAIVLSSCRSPHRAPLSIVSSVGV